MKLDKKWNKRKTELFTSKGTDQNLTVKVADPLPKKLKVVVDKSADPAPSTAAFDVDNYLDHQDLVNCFEIVSNLDAWDVFKEKVSVFLLSARQKDRLNLNCLQSSIG